MRGGWKYARFNAATGLYHAWHRSKGEFTIPHAMVQAAYSRFMAISVDCPNPAPRSICERVARESALRCGAYSNLIGQQGIELYRPQDIPFVEGLAARGGELARRAHRQAA